MGLLCAWNLLVYDKLIFVYVTHILVYYYMPMMLPNHCVWSCLPSKQFGRYINAYAHTKIRAVISAHPSFSAIDVS